MVLSSGNGKFAGLAEVAPNKCSFHRVQRCLCFEDATAAHVYLLSYCSWRISSSIEVQALSGRLREQSLVDMRREGFGET